MPYMEVKRLDGTHEMVTMGDLSDDVGRVSVFTRTGKKFTAVWSDGKWREKPASWWERLTNFRSQERSA